MKPIAAALFLAGLLVPCGAGAQALTFALSVDEELDAGTVRRVDFRQASRVGGRLVIALGDESVGVFRIRGNPHTQVHVRLAASELRSPIGAVMPIRMELAFANRDRDSIDDARVLPESGIFFPLREVEPVPARRRGRTGISAGTVTAYLYLFGELDGSELPRGRYSGYLRLIIEYS